ncbi:MAG: spermidine/putrescine ABC transporter substrate-binding protein [Acidobacteria bacterium]|jgi:spermidine/putrescine transport system substrate-binding protein|nr:spermidine/putrescine ABC transporter substrate-binding protein [Acidobacteriota bacterium]
MTFPRRAALPVLALTALTALALALTGCSKPQPVLHVYTWADYIQPELIRQFETQTGSRVVIDTFDSNEAMYAKIKAGASGYDLITPSSYMVSIMNREGLLRPLDHAKLPNLKNVDPEYLAIALDPKMQHSVPYMLTNTGIAYLKSKVPDFQASWSAFDRADLGRRVTMLNDMRETIGAALKFLGYSLNTTSDQELEQARDLVIRWKRNLAKFENEQYKSGLASGEFVMVHGYSGDIVQVQGENEDIAFAAPQEGTSVSCDDLVIPKSAKEVDLAHAFVDFLHDPKNAAANSEFIGYLCPNSASYPLLPEEFRANPAVFLDPAVRARSEVILDLGDENRKYTRVWDQIKAAD